MSPPRNAAKPIAPDGPRPGDPVAPAHRDVAEIRAARRSRRPPERQRGAGRRVDLVAVMHFHDLDVPVRAEPGGDLLDQTEQQVDPETGIGGPDDRDRACGLAHCVLLGAVQSGRADHERLAEPSREGSVLGGGGGRGEFDRDIAGAEQRLGIGGGDDAETADAGQLAEILAAAALPGRATPPESAHPSVAAMSATSMRPTRPATPMTPILTSAIAAFLPETTPLPLPLPPGGAAPRAWCAS